jgi:hypothetical protein
VRAVSALWTWIPNAEAFASPPSPRRARAHFQSRFYVKSLLVNPRALHHEHLAIYIYRISPRYRADRADPYTSIHLDYTTHIDEIPSKEILAFFPTIIHLRLVLSL